MSQKTYLNYTDIPHEVGKVEVNGLIENTTRTVREGAVIIKAGPR